MMVVRCLAVLLLAGSACAGSLPQRNAQGLLVDSGGHVLYRYDPDGSSGVSHCSGSCAAVWPPYLADSRVRASGGYGVTLRGDGGFQWVYRGHPLYLFVGDGKPGDRDGDGVNGSWHVLR
ncbi:MAG: hypothetical protein ABIQ36_12560 [Rhodanobacter sp.]